MGGSRRSLEICRAWTPSLEAAGSRDLRNMPGRTLGALGGGTRVFFPSFLSVPLLSSSFHSSFLSFLPPSLSPSVQPDVWMGGCWGFPGRAWRRHGRRARQRDLGWRCPCAGPGRWLKPWQRMRSQGRGSPGSKVWRAASGRRWGAAEEGS